MAFKHKDRKAHAFPGINFKGHLLEGMSWPMRGSKCDYDVTLTNKGFKCECDGFYYYGKCRHITAVGQKMAS